MTRKILTLVLLLPTLILLPVQAQQDTSDNYQKANEQYKQGSYTNAIALYQEELKRGVSADLYYNLGNAYYKTNDLGLAILNYKRALRIAPTMSDAQYNLKLVQSKIIDQIEEQPTFFLKKWKNNLVLIFTSNQWVYCGLFCFVLMLTTLLLFFFSRKKNNRKIYFILSVTFALFFSFSLYASVLKKNQLIKHNEAVIVQGAVTVKSSPDEQGTDIFQLHEGTCVSIKNQLGDWSEITLQNGAIGWVKNVVFEKI